MKNIMLNTIKFKNAKLAKCKMQNEKLINKKFTWGYHIHNKHH